jgi:hypothetical protein
LPALPDYGTVALKCSGTSGAALRAEQCVYTDRLLGDAQRSTLVEPVR